MSINAATILGGPALVTHRGATFYSKGNIALASQDETFQLEADRFGVVEERVSEQPLSVEFEPAGEWESLAVLWPYASTLLGSLISPQSLLVSAINTTTEQLTVTAHGLATADAVMVHVETGGTLPTSTPALSQSTRYYVRVVDANTVTLHPTASDATGNLNAINFSAAGTGNFYLDRDHPLVIHTFAGIKLTLFNAAVVQMPAIRGSAVNTLIGPVRFEAFLQNGGEWSDTDARWKIESAALSDTTFDPANIKTLPLTAAWGSVAPWDNFDTAAGWNVEFPLELAPVSSDRHGVRTRRLVRVGANATARPIGIDENQILTKRLLQGATNARGRSYGVSDHLNLTASGVYIRLYGAALTRSGINYSSRELRPGELQWVAQRTFTGGAPNAMFFVGTAAPS